MSSFLAYRSRDSGVRGCGGAGVRGDRGGVRGGGPRAGRSPGAINH